MLFAGQTLEHVPQSLHFSVIQKFLSQSLGLKKVLYNNEQTS